MPGSAGLGAERLTDDAAASTTAKAFATLWTLVPVKSGSS